MTTFYTGNICILTVHLHSYFSHTECILSATWPCNSTLLTRKENYTTIQQHFIDISVNITTTELESTTGENYPNIDTLLRQWLTKGWEGGKTESLDWADTDILTCTKVPHSVWENFVSCLFCKLSQQEKLHVHFKKLQWNFNLSNLPIAQTNTFPAPPHSPLGWSR